MGMSRRWKAEGGMWMVVIGLVAIATAGCLRVPVFPSLRWAAEPVLDDSLLGRWRVHEVDEVFDELGFRDEWIEVVRCGEGYAVYFRCNEEDTIIAHRYLLLYEIGGRTYAAIEASPADGRFIPGVRDFVYWLERGQDAVRLRTLSRDWLNKHFQATRDFPYAIANVTSAEFLEALSQVTEDDFDEPDGMSYRRDPSNERDAQLSANCQLSAN